MAQEEDHCHGGKRRDETMTKNKAAGWDTPAG